MHLSFILTLSPLHLCSLLHLYLSSQFVMKLVNKLLYRVCSFSQLLHDTSFWLYFEIPTFCISKNTGSYE